MVLLTLLMAGASFFLMTLPREQFTLLILLFSLLFFLYTWQLKGLKEHPLPDQSSFWWLFGAGMLLRLSVFPFLPNLTDDFWRFLWDGNLWLEGIHPLRHKPVEVLKEVADPAFYEAIFPALNSPQYHTIYPPVLQGIFAGSAALAPKQVLAPVLLMKAIVLVAEALTLWLLWKLLAGRSNRPFLLALYALNPLIIIELIGNLHFEALLVTSILLLLLFLRQQKPMWAGIALAAGVGVKLLPLLLFPLGFATFLRQAEKGKQRALVFTAAFGGASLLLFLPFLQPLYLEHLLSSIRLYYASFSFNAGAYEWLRTGLGAFIPEHAREVTNFLTSAAVVAVVLWQAVRVWQGRQTVAAGAFWVLSIYFFLASTIHPWYLAALLALMPFTRWRFPLIWAVLIPFSYITYQQEPYQQQPLFIGLMWAVVLAYLLWEWRQKSPSTTSTSG